jgi:ABC-type branched-subunit amino acid transport system substrate-binding protein
VSTRWIRRLLNWVTLTPLRTGAAGTLTLVLLAALGFGVVTWINLSDRCGVGVEHRGPAHECTGVTDGGYLFAPQLSAVEKAIVRENQSINDARHATIALLLPLTSPDPFTQAEILHAIQGAYVAQYRANHNQNGQVPLIRLVLANPGLNSAQWQPVVQQLKEMTGSPDNLRAVVGISVSTAATKDEVGWLTSHGIPVVGGAITADDIANSPGGDHSFPGLARVEPTNSQEASALARFAVVNPKQALLVEDTRKDDDYITTLAKAFSARLTGSPLEPYQFTSPPDITQDGDTANQFAQMIPNICDTHAKWIYFAGRQVQLRQFINALGARGCQENFTILTGSAGSHLGSDPKLDRGAFTGITLDYAAIASPGPWTIPDPPATGGSPAAYRAFAMTVAETATAPAGPIGLTDLSDGQTIINYDATWTAIFAIRNTTTQLTPMPSLPDIMHEWPLLNGVNKVLGASGWICLDNAGNPYDKAVPIVRYSATGRSVFVALAWPTGAPPPAPCTIPPGG